MNLPAVRWVLKINLLASCGNAHGHVLIPIELINIISELVALLLHAMMNKFWFEYPRFFNVLERIN